MGDYGVIFDMDGVLVDSFGLHYESWRVTAERRGYELPVSRFRPVFGRTNRSIIPVVAGREVPPDEVAAWGREKETVYREILARRFPAMPGADALLDALRADGARLAIGTSGPPENVDAVLANLPAARRVDAIVTGRDVRTGKPDPEVFLLAAGKLGLPPSACAVVEDSLAGLEAARRAGAAAIALVGTADRATLAPQSDLVVDALNELTPARVRSLLAGRRA
jgi:HAD superfamily hydrolase (TIGR01509 family)